jgi:hypothetical protein
MPIQAPTLTNFGRYDSCRPLTSGLLALALGITAMPGVALAAGPMAPSAPAMSPAAPVAKAPGSGPAPTVPHPSGPAAIYGHNVSTPVIGADGKAVARPGTVTNKDAFTATVAPTSTGSTSPSTQKK